MKITKERLNKIIKEEMTKEGLLDWAKAKAARRWDWWENETEMTLKPHPDTPPEVLKEIPHWMDIMKEWGLWPCSEAKIRRWWQRVGKGGFASAHEPVPARHNCAARIKLAKQSALEKAGASGAQQSRRIKSDRKLASDRRSQKIQKAKAEARAAHKARAARKAGERAKMGITKEQLERIIKEEFANVIKEMSDDAWMYDRFLDAPQHSDAATPGKTTRQSNVAGQEEPVSRGGHPADHPKADVYKQQMRDLDRHLEEELTIALLEREDSSLDLEAMKELYKDKWLYVSGAGQVGASDSDIENMALAHTFKELNIDPKSELASTLAPILTKTI